MLSGSLSFLPNHDDTVSRQRRLFADDPLLWDPRLERLRPFGPGGCASRQLTVVVGGSHLAVLDVGRGNWAHLLHEFMELQWESFQLDACASSAS